ncbi:HAMP domain-containing sensor histidine kinase [Polycladomyces subterraneus]|uniref:histidine kinase n=1 Tax=Polycladomyces subterraneus TaxID=1016997 RepID=A0ABT8IQI5_9BACL|nr:HAMP domain-containing sensor histidine kinase [Polycladomyces subterraneus]MDN4595065.1 HAMP domain-containing histidine kinase [Polycladomyces subterraneus]
MIRWIRKMWSRLRTRMIVVFLISLAAMLVGGTIGEKLTIREKRYYYYPGEEEITHIFLSHYAREMSQIRAAKRNTWLNSLEQTSRMRLRVLDHNGSLLYQSAHAPRRRENIHNLFFRMMRQSDDLSTSGGVQNLTFVYPFYLDHQPVYLVADWRGNGQPVGQGNPLMSFCSGILSFWLVYHLLTRGKLRQIAAMSRGVQEIAQGRWETRVPEKGDDELGILGRHINEMARKLKESREKEKRLDEQRHELITSISHDLRTPLTSMIGYLLWIRDHPDVSETEIRRYAGIGLSKAQSMKRLIEDLFDYAKWTHHQVPIRKTRLSFNRLIEQLAEETIPLAEREQMSIRLDLCEDPLELDGDPDLLVRMLDNVFHNALQHGIRPGEMVITTVREGDMAVLKVKNMADPLPKEILNRLFDVFVTGERSRSWGSGVGLAIVRMIAEMHGGYVTATQDQGSLMIQFRLPLLRR